MGTYIEWCDETWNPIIGCWPVSSGCKNCYASRFATRHAGNPRTPQYHGIAQGGRWTGETQLVEKALDQPLRWRKPRRIFVCSMGDFFHSSVKRSWQLAVWRTIEACPHHTFLILTKRPHYAGLLHQLENELTYRIREQPWPLPHVWLGVSVEDQATADERIPLLLDIPAAKRFVSYEPALGPVRLDNWVPYNECDNHPAIDWVIAGAERGPGARPAQLDWFRSVRDQCQAAGVPFFFKKDSDGNREIDGRRWEQLP